MYVLTLFTRNVDVWRHISNSRPSQSESVGRQPINSIGLAPYRQLPKVTHLAEPRLSQLLPLSNYNLTTSHILYFSTLISASRKTQTEATIRTSIPFFITVKTQSTNTCHMRRTASSLTHELQTEPNQNVRQAVHPRRRGQPQHRRERSLHHH